jgi:hypothetical protein
MSRHKARRKRKKKGLVMITSDPLHPNLSKTERRKQLGVLGRSGSGYTERYPYCDT